MSGRSPVALALLLLAPVALSAQLEAPSTGGIVRLQQELRMLGQHKRVLMIGAHPDDEDTELLTWLVRGQGAEAAYLSLNRGEGGQNLIGPELGEALGLVRSEELLAARRLDGARQFFTRAYDYGYSKTIDEAWQLWPRDSVLLDVVRVVRAFQPQVIVSIFSGTPRDGHGQHQAAGWAAQEAFRIAGDPGHFPEAGPPWIPLKLFRSTRFDSAATTLSLEGGELDPAVGQTYRQIAMRGRSLHRSQDMGQLQRIGPSDIRLQLVEDRTGGNGASLFAGVDTTFSGASAPGWRGAAAYRRLTLPLAGGALPRQSAELLARLDSASQLLRQAPASTPAIQDQHTHLEQARLIAAGVLVDLVTDDARVVPGQVLRLLASVWNPSDRARTIEIRLEHSARWEPVGRAIRLTVPAGRLGQDTIVLRVKEGATPTRPYFLEAPRDGELYRWPEGAPVGMPFQEAEVVGVFEVEGLGTVRREAMYRVNDQAYGERRMPLAVIPRLDVRLAPAHEVWSTTPAPHVFTVTVSHGAGDSTSGTVMLELPGGWPAVPPQPFAFGREGERRSFEFTVRPPREAGAGRYTMAAVAVDHRQRRWAEGVLTVDYPHIRERRWTEPALAEIRIAPLELPKLERVGYVRGASDRVPEALSAVGVPVVLLTRADLERGDLSRYDAIVVGSRAYETDSALVSNNERLLAYVRNGGLLIVQYQQHGFFRGEYAPFPLTVGGQPLRLQDDGTARPAGPPVSHDRVTDERAPVRILDAGSPVVSRPNRLGPADWNDWVQERGLYFARSWDPAYRPALEMADPGEAPLAGGLLVAQVGEGTWVYTGLSFFRQLPAGVPGAFRLFANLLALAGS